MGKTTSRTLILEPASEESPPQTRCASSSRPGTRSSSSTRSRLFTSARGKRGSCWESGRRSRSRSPWRSCSRVASDWCRESCGGSIRPGAPSSPTEERSAGFSGSRARSRPRPGRPPRPFRGSSHLLHAGGAVRLRAALEGFAGGDIAILIPKIPFKCPPRRTRPRCSSTIGSRCTASMKRRAFPSTPSREPRCRPPDRRSVSSSAASWRIADLVPSAETTVRSRRGPGAFTFRTGATRTTTFSLRSPRTWRASRPGPAARRAVGLDSGGTADAEGDGPPGAGRGLRVGDVTTVPLPGRFKPDMPLSLPKAGVFAGRRVGSWRTRLRPGCSGLRWPKRSTERDSAIWKQAAVAP